MSNDIPAKGAVWQWMIQPLRRYADFTGRSGRREFWFYCLFLSVLYLAAFAVTIGGIVAGDSDATEPGLGSAGAVGLMIGITAMSLIFLINFMPALALTARRFHDIGLSGWLSPASVVAVFVLSVIAWIPYMIVMALPPQKGTNAYGSPVYDEDMVADVFA